MGDVRVELRDVWKKFRKGERHDSLRDLIPDFAKKIVRGRRSRELEDKEFWALKDVSFQIRSGEAFGLIGNNGAGKSTILKLLSGILRQDKGEIIVDGRISALIEVGAGFHPELTGRENIYLNGAILGMKKEEIDRKFDEIVEFSGIGDFIDTPVKRFSSGMYARLGFSVAAHVDPDILLVDEVLSVGDMGFQKKCIDKMLSFKESGTTVIFVSHNLEAINVLCKKTALLNSGRLVALDDTAEVIKRYLGSINKTDDVSHGDNHGIWNVRLRDGENADCSVFYPGQKAEVSFFLKNDIPFEQCSLQFMIYRTSDAFAVCDYHLPLGEFQASTSDSDAKAARLTFETNLLRGSYNIFLSVFQTVSGKLLNISDNTLYFSVEERNSWSGVAHLNPRIGKE